MLHWILGFVFSHFANTAFYRALKFNKTNTHNHPVVATIFDYIEVGANGNKTVM